MATCSCIVVKLADNTYRGVYCHSDGYPSWVGRLLQDQYNSQRLAEALTAMGDLSQLADSLEDTISYFNWRGEPIQLTTGKTNADVRDQLDCQYNYLFADGKWTVAEWKHSANRWTPAKLVTRYRDAKGNWHDEARRP